MREALLYERLPDGRVRCALCAHRCVIAEGERGVCRVREHHDGALYTRVYGLLVAQAIDPIEKKPLFHFYPATRTYSIATTGCNLRCSFCQNADISQAPRETAGILGRYIPPEAVVEAAKRSSCRSIAYTYSEPTIFFEYALDVARLAQFAGLANVYVSNGYMTPEMLEMLTLEGEPALLDAANVDLKAFSDAFYREQCGARLQPVLDSLRAIKLRGVWLEVTTLIIPGLNDSEGELQDIARFIRDDLGVDTPWHVSRFHPSYHLTDRPPTPAATVLRAREIGLQEGLRYVYAGNLPGRGEDTLCPRCGRAIIHRVDFTVTRNDLLNGICNHCGAHLDGVGL